MSSPDAQNTTHSSNQRRRLIAPIALAAVAVTGVGVLTTTALFSDESTVDNNTFSAGTVDLSTNPTSTAFHADAMSPGDVVTAPVTVRNDGSLNFRYAMTSTATGTLASALTIQVKSGVTACTNAGFGATGTSLYGATAPIGTAEGMKVFGDSKQGPDTGDRVLDAGDSEILCVQVTLPGAATGNAYQAQSADVTFTFNAEQTKNNGADNSDDNANNPPLAAPAGFGINLGDISGYTLSWAEPEGVDGIYVYRSADAGHTWWKVADVPYPTSTWTDPNPGISPIYALVSYTSNGNTSGSPGDDGSAVKTPPAPVPGAVTQIATGIGQAYDAIYVAETDSLYIINGVTGVLEKLDPSTGTYVHFANSPGNVPLTGVAFDSADHNLYVSLGAKGLYRVSTSDGSFTKMTLDTSAALGLNGGGGSITYDSTRDVLYVTSDRNIFAVSPSTGVATLAATLPAVSGSLVSPRYDAATDTLYVADQTKGVVYRVALSTGQASVVVSGFGMIGGLALTPNSGTVYVTDVYGTVNKIASTTGEILNSTAIPVGAYAIVYDPSNDSLYTTDLGGTGNVYKVVP